MQNPRSPEQQYDSIDLVLRRAGYAWVHALDYRDDAISGRFVAKRPGLQQMLADLRSGRVQADLILVDTYERLGRAEEIGLIRKQLQTRHKILVLTADSNFTDPTSSGGRALSFLEDFRATEDNNVKAHNILCGKRDLAKQRRWPGGPVPAGLMLESIMIVRDGRQEVDGHRIVPDPATRIAPTRAFALALQEGWGSRRIARELNADPAVPAGLKPISDERVRLWLRNPLFKGMLTYGRCHTGIVDDKYVREAADPDELVIIADFCEPLVSPEVFEKVNELRRARAEARAPQIAAPGRRRGRRVGRPLARGPEVPADRRDPLRRMRRSDGSLLEPLDQARWGLGLPLLQVQEVLHGRVHPPVRVPGGDPEGRGHRQVAGATLPGPR